MTLLRRRSGKAWTERNPALTARVAKTAAAGHHLEELEDVEVIDKGVSHLDKNLGQLLHRDHDLQLSRIVALTRVPAVQGVSRSNFNVPTTMSLATSLRESPSPWA